MQVSEMEVGSNWQDWPKNGPRSHHGKKYVFWSLQTILMCIEGELTEECLWLWLLALVKCDW